MSFTFRIREFTTCANKIPCVLAKFPNSLCFPWQGIFQSLSRFPLCTGDPESRSVSLSDSPWSRRVCGSCPWGGRPGSDRGGGCPGRASSSPPASDGASPRATCLQQADRHSEGVSKEVNVSDCVPYPFPWLVVMATLRQTNHWTVTTGASQDCLVGGTERQTVT